MQNKLSRRDFLKMAAASGAVAAFGPAMQQVALASPAKQEAVTITMVESWFGVPQFKESLDPVMEAISDKLQKDGLNIRVQSMILDDHRAKYPLLYSSGADFTMAFDAPWYQMDTLRQQGALAELEGLIGDVGADLKQEITDKIYNANFNGDHLYGIPAAYYYRSITGAFIREDLREKYGAPAPTSSGGYASLEPYLQAVKDNNPDMIPYANSVLQTMIRPLLTMPRHYPAPGNTGLIMSDFSKSTEFANYEDVPEVLEAAKLQRSWFEKGLINQTDLPNSQASENLFADYFLTGRAGGNAQNDPNQQWFEFQKQLNKALPEAKVMGYELAGLTDKKIRPMGVLKQFNFIVFNAAAPAEQQKAGVQFFNWLASSQDNMDLWLMGIEGVNYKKEDNLQFSEIDGVDQSRNYRRQWYVSGLSGRYQRQPTDLPKSILDALSFLTTEENWDFFEYESFTPDTKALEQWTTQLSAVFNEAVHGLSTGQLPVEEAVAQYKNTLDGAGRKELKDALQKQFDDYVSQHKS